MLYIKRVSILMVSKKKIKDITELTKPQMQIKKCSPNQLQYQCLIFEYCNCKLLASILFFIFLRFGPHGLCFPDKKRLDFRNLVQVPKVWSVFIRASFLVHVPQFHPFFILPDFCARVDNSARLSTISL